MEIIRMPDNGEYIAGYDVAKDRISYNERLDLYPELKSLMLNHEINHRRHRYNLFYHVYLDIKDMKDYLRRDFYEYWILQLDRPPLSKSDKWVHFGYLIFSLVRPVICAPFVLLSLIINFTRDYFKTKVKK